MGKKVTSEDRQKTGEKKTLIREKVDTSSITPLKRKGSIHLSQCLNLKYYL